MHKRWEYNEDLSLHTMWLFISIYDASSFFRSPCEQRVNRRLGHDMRYPYEQGENCTSEHDIGYPNEQGENHTSQRGIESGSTRWGEIGNFCSIFFMNGVRVRSKELQGNFEDIGCKWSSLFFSTLNRCVYSFAQHWFPFFIIIRKFYYNILYCIS